MGRGTYSTTTSNRRALCGAVANGRVVRAFGQVIVDCGISVTRCEAAGIAFGRNRVVIILHVEVGVMVLGKRLEICLECLGLDDSLHCPLSFVLTKRVHSLIKIMSVSKEIALCVRVDRFRISAPCSVWLQAWMFLYLSVVYRLTSQTPTYQDFELQG